MNKKSLNIAHLSTLHSRYDTRIFLKECKTLSNAGHNIFYLVGDGKGDENKNKVKIIDIGNPPKSRLSRLIVQSYRAYKILNKMQPDILHFHDPELMFVSKMLQSKNTQVIFDVHEDVAKGILTKIWIPFNLRSLVANIYIIFEKLLTPNMGLVLAERSYLDSYKIYKHNRKAVVENLPLEKITRIGSNNTKYPVTTFAYLGSITVSRGAIKMIKTIKKLREKGQNVRLVFIGPVNDEVSSSPFYKRAIEEGWLDSYGYMQADNALKIIQKCHVGLAILDSEPNYINSYPTKMFEYMGLGLPVIVSNFSLYQAVVNDSDCGFTVEPKDEKQLEYLMNFLISHPEQATKFGLNGKKAIISKYNWSTQANNLMKFYDYFIS